jgi:hypothetical protein
MTSVEDQVYLELVRTSVSDAIIFLENDSKYAEEVFAQEISAREQASKAIRALTVVVSAHYVIHTFF